MARFNSSKKRVYMDFMRALWWLGDEIYLADRNPESFFPASVPCLRDTSNLRGAIIHQRRRDKYLVMLIPMRTEESTPSLGRVKYIWIEISLVSDSGLIWHQSFIPSKSWYYYRIYKLYLQTFGWSEFACFAPSGNICFSSTFLEKKWVFRSENCNLGVDRGNSSIDDV